MPRIAKTAEESIREEQRDIRRRRKVHETPHSSDPKSDASSPRTDDLTGLTLSGGGIRSAAFSLGFIQAMYRAGRMKAFDYLSTVSGGGYAGGMFSAVVARESNKINWDRNGKYNRLDIEPPPEGGQPDSVERLALHGRMMGDFVRLFSRHLWGFLINVTFITSGLFAIAALLAYFMRLPWNPTMGPILSELEFRTDLTVPFFFTFVASLIWLASHILARIAKLVGTQIAPFSQYSYLLLLGTVVLGLLTMLAIGDIDLGAFFAGKSGNDQLSLAVNQVVHWLGIAISAAFITTLLPYLTPKRLLQSGDPGAGPMQSLVFRAAGNALIIGAPLFVFFFLVHENISGWNSSRPNADQLTPSHLGSPTDFATQLESQATSIIEPRKKLARHIYAALNGTDEPEKTDWKKLKFQNELDQLQRTAAEARLANEKFGFGRRCLQWFANAISIDDQFGRRLEAIESSKKKQEKIVGRFNECVLSDPTLFINLAKESRFAGPSEGTEPANSLANSPTDRADAILNAFGLPKSAPKSSDDDHLARAFESLRAANNQLATRFSGLTLLLPEADKSVNLTSSDRFTGALVQLACNESTLEVTDLSTIEKITRIKPGTYGRFVSAMDRLLEDESKTLQSRVENVLAKLGTSASTVDDFDSWKAKQALVVGDLSRQVREGNWHLLQAIYPKFIRPQDTVFARVVNEADQAYRLPVAQ